MHHNEEARYHFILMDMVDLIGDYGFDTVMADLDVAIADKVNRLVQRAVLEEVESGLITTGKLEIKNTFDGPDQVSIGHQVRIWTAQ